MNIKSWSLTQECQYHKKNDMILRKGKMLNFLRNIFYQPKTFKTILTSVSGPWCLIKKVKPILARGKRHFIHISWQKCWYFYIKIFSIICRTENIVLKIDCFKIPYTYSIYFTHKWFQMIINGKCVQKLFVLKNLTKARRKNLPAIGIDLRQLGADLDPQRPNSEVWHEHWL